MKQPVFEYRSLLTSLPEVEELPWEEGWKQWDLAVNLLDKDYETRSTRTRRTEEA